MEEVRAITEVVVETVEKEICRIADTGVKSKDVHMITYNRWNSDPMYRVELEVKGMIKAVILLMKDLSIKVYRY